MDFITIITMIIVLGVVWGGTVTFLTRAMKYEKMKGKNEQSL
jgi:hypothetical protein